MQTVAAVEAAIKSFRQPSVDQAVREPMRRSLSITYDFDLTGQAVSSTSTTYPEADISSRRVNDQVQLGYQLARVCLSSQASERMWLVGFHHAARDDTVSAARLKELVHAAKAQTGVRHCPELVAQRIDAQ